MPYARKTLTQLRDDALGDIASATIRDASTGQVVSVQLLANSPLRCLGYMTAAGVYSGYGYLDWIALQSVPWTATGERARGWGALKGVTIKAATPAISSELVPSAVAVNIPLGAVLSRNDGVQYAVTAEVAIPAGGTAKLPFQATASGAAGNAPAGTTLTFQQPVPGLASSLVTANPITGGADDEDEAAFRDRYLAVYANPPAGGSATDYVRWATEVPGVTRAWCQPNGFGAGTVVVYTMWDTAEAGSAGFPQGTGGVAAAEARDTPATGDQLAVANHIFPLRPVTALVYSLSPNPLYVDFVFANLGAPMTQNQVAVVAAALDALFLDISSPLGVTLLPRRWEAALAAVPGLPDFTLVSPVGPVVCPPGRLAVRGNVSGTA